MKKINYLILILLLLLFLPNCKEHWANKENTNSTPTPQTETSSTEYLDIGSGQEMMYALLIPESYKQGEPVPLILALHYGGEHPGIGAEFMNLLVYPTLKDLNAIIIAPDAPGDNWYDPISEKAVLQLVDQIKGEYSIDSNKVLVTGYSMGGVGTWHFASMFPEIFKLGIAIAAAPTEQALNQWGQTPLFVIHSRDDTVFPIDEIEPIVNKLKAEGKPISSIFFDGIGHYDPASYETYLRQTLDWIRSNW